METSPEEAAIKAEEPTIKIEETAIKVENPFEFVESSLSYIKFEYQPKVGAPIVIKEENELMLDEDFHNETYSFTEVVDPLEIPESNANIQNFEDVRRSRRVLSCTRCSEKFTDKKVLMRHLMAHVDDASFEPSVVSALSSVLVRKPKDLSKKVRTDMVLRVEGEIKDVDDFVREQSVYSDASSAKKRKTCKRSSTTLAKKRNGKMARVYRINAPSVSRSNCLSSCETGVVNRDESSNQSKTYYDANCIRLQPVSVLLENIDPLISGKDLKVGNKSQVSVISSDLPGGSASQNQLKKDSGFCGSKGMVGQGGKEEWFPCPVCPSQFKSRMSLNRHLSKHCRNGQCSYSKYLAELGLNLDAQSSVSSDSHPETSNKINIFAEKSGFCNSEKLKPSDENTGISSETNISTEKSETGISEKLKPSDSHPEISNETNISSENPGFYDSEKLKPSDSHPGTSDETNISSENPGFYYSVKLKPVDSHPGTSDETNISSENPGFYDSVKLKPVDSNNEKSSKLNISSENQGFCNSEKSLDSHPRACSKTNISAEKPDLRCSGKLNASDSNHETSAETKISSEKPDLCDSEKLKPVDSNHGRSSETNISTEKSSLGNSEKLKTASKISNPQEVRSSRRVLSCSHCAEKFTDKTVLMKHLIASCGDDLTSCDDVSREIKQKNVSENQLSMNTNERLVMACDNLSDSPQIAGDNSRDSPQVARDNLRDSPQVASDNSRNSPQVAYDNPNDSPQLAIDNSRNSPQVKSFLCPMCPKHYALRGNFVNHLNTHSDEQILSCRHCPLKLETKKMYVSHLIEKHMTVSCSYCSKKFPLISLLRIHEVLHTDAKPFACTECPARFKRKGDLNVHLKKHFGKAEFKCTLCPFQFFRRNDFNKHLRSHGRREKYKCAHCSYRCNEKNHLSRHMVKHSSKRKFSCTICSAKFKWGTHFHRHVRSHSSSEDFGCSLCSIKFKNSNLMRDHLQKYHGPVKRFSCANCSNSFRYKNDLKKHLKKKHTHSG